MSVWRVHGGNRLSGNIRIQGSKNAVLPIMAASIVTGCETELTNCPRLRDVDASMAILRHLGCAVSREDDIINIDSNSLHSSFIPHDLMREMRSSVIFLGAILGRCGEAALSLPGGCELGSRPVDLHLEALRTLGAEVIEQGGEIRCRARELIGAPVNLSSPSVGATENAMLAACAARGETVITNAAREPEIVDLQNYLRLMGAEISGAGTSTITVSGFRPKKRVGHRIMSDRIVASTIMCAVASAGGSVVMTGVRPEHFETVSAELEQMGCEVTRSQNSVRIESGGRLRAAKPVITKPYPGFPTDAQPLLMAASLKAAGTTVFMENIFESRYRHAGELKRMGADIRTEGRVAVVTGVPELYGAPVTSTDLRGGAALVTAGLAAVGETVVFDSGHIDRGYDALEAQLSGLGADITKE